jgi:hypothetical protein
MFSSLGFSKKQGLETHNVQNSEKKEHTEGFVIDTKPTPEEKETERYLNIKSFFNRSYLEATGLGIGAIAAVVLIAKYTKK